ncbi:MAG: HAMP domain-containing histidine kinase [Solobacterium sp.]|nr:HAMP domain-containing histidine kinase [Solobacterium sp.]
MKKKSLRFQITLYLVIFAAGLIALLTFFQTYLLEPMYEKYKVDTVRKAADEVLAALNEETQENLTDTIWSISASNDTCVRVIDTYGADELTGNMGCVLYRMNTKQILEQYDLARENSNEYLSVSEGMMPLPGGPGGDRRPPEGTEMKNITLTRVVDTDYGTSIIMVYAGLTPVSTTIQTLRVQILYIAGILFVSVILLAFFMNRSIATPLMKINEAAKTLPNGTYEADESTGRYREAQELNDTLYHAAEEIQKADKAKRDLIANVSHDLRTPLTMIRGYGEMMRDLPGEKTDENLEVIINESQRLKYLVDDLLDLSKLDSNVIELHPTVFSISELVRRNVQKYSFYHSQEGFEIRVDCPEELMVYADESRIEQVFNNFMTNAVNYSGNSRVIEIRVKRNGKNARTEVQDFGEGIASEKLKDIWDRFYKIDREHIRRTNSSGLGLNICQRLLKLHNAPYGVESEIGKGSTFWFELPLQESTAEENRNQKIEGEN